VTLFAKPPEGATASMNLSGLARINHGWAEGAACQRKIHGRRVTSTGAEALLAKKATSPLYNAVMLCVLTPERTALKLAMPLTNRRGSDYTVAPSRKVTLPVGVRVGRPRRNGAVIVSLYCLGGWSRYSGYAGETNGERAEQAILLLLIPAEK